MTLWDSVYSFLYWFVGAPVVTMASIVAVVHILYWKLRVNRHWSRTMRMKEVGGYFKFYFCAIIQSLHMKKGIFTPQLKNDQPVPVTNKQSAMGSKNKVLAVFHPDNSDEKMTIVECHMFHQALSRYRKCIEFKGDNMEVPPCFMTVYFNKSLIALGSSELSRVPILGAVHFRQQITVYQDLSHLLTSFFSMHSYAEEYRITERGVEVDVGCGILDEHDILVWEAIVTGISLLPNDKKIKQKKEGISSKKEPYNEDSFVPYKQDLLTSYKRTGIEFAKATLDYQPQHLYKWSANLVGFKKPIAHGLWTMGASVEKIVRSESCYRNAYPLQLETSFRRPLVLGYSALLQYEKPEGPRHMSNFRVIDPNTKVCYVTGKIYVGAKETE